MIKDMIVSSTVLETRVAILEDDQLAELYIERHGSRGILANIYKGKVTKVLPGMQSAFVNIGMEKDAFLYVSDFIEENDDFETVQDSGEDPVEVTAAEAEAPPRPARRERKGDRGRWRERRERPEASKGPEEAEAPQADSLEHFNISAETERETESHFQAGVLNAESESDGAQWKPDSESGHTPPPEDFDMRRNPNEREPVAALAEAPTGTGPETERVTPEDGLLEVSRGDETRGAIAAEPASTEIPAADTAVIRDDGETCSLSSTEYSKTGFVRRRGAATRRKRYTTARHSHRAEHQSIDTMLHEGQEVLVQIAKEPIAKKGARVTSHIALPGRYLVYMPTVDHIGVSRKIGSDAERMRLKEILLKHRDQFPGGVIVRTAAEEHSEEDLVNDLQFLVRIWEDMRIRAEKVAAPALIHAEMNLVQRLLRDQFSFEFASIRVDDELEYQKIVEFVDKIYPNLVHRVKLHTKDRSIFDEYGIAPEIDKLLQPKIWLKSGGYIVINQTEALVSIDVNTGKFVGRGNSLEETITRTNLEAVKEIVRQVRLRDLGGIIVVDFIDMDERKNRKRVMDALAEETAKDKSPTKVLEFNEFGLVAITRKRVKQSLERSLCQPCPYCSGSGMVKSIATTCHNIYHEIEKMRGCLDERSELMIRVHPDVARALRESESGVIEELKHLLRRDILVKGDSSLHIEHYNIVT